MNFLFDSDEERKIISANLRELRKACKFKQGQVEDRIHMGQRTLTRYEREHKNFDYKDLEKYAKAYDVPMMRILEGIDDPYWERVKDDKLFNLIDKLDKDRRERLRLSILFYCIEYLSKEDLDGIDVEEYRQLYNETLKRLHSDKDSDFL